MFINKEKVLSTFLSVPELIETYFKNIPEEYLDKRDNETAWTVREHLYHLAGVQEMLYQRMLKIRDEKEPVITPYFPENEENRDSLYKSIDEAISYFKAMREKQALLVEQLTEDVLNKEAEHEEYRHYNIPIILNHMIFHEYWHMYRIEEIWLSK